MSSTLYLLIGIAIMAIITYIIRVTPMVVFRKKITNQYVKSFLYYVPYTVLAAMTLAILLAYFKKGLLAVALGAAATVLVVSLLGF